MPRLKNTKTGAVVSVADEKVARMGDQWESADKPEAKKAPAKKASASKSED